MRKQKISRNIFICLVIIFNVFLSFSMLGTAAQAAGLIDNTINLTNEYSKFSLENYQLDFYVDTSWDWLPWNWSDGIGKSVQYALYAITNFIWTLSTYISGATGYVIQQAYKLDFIADTSEFIGKNMQTLAGVNENGFSGQGFYTGFLLLFILIIGIYVTYTGLLKREATKAVRSVINFVLVFILSASFIAYAPEYIQKINSFSADVSNASLSIGTKIVLPDSDSQGRDSVDLIRDSLFSIQVQKPWLLLQYGKTNVDKERYQNLLCETPDSKDRMEIVIEEIEDNNNSYMSVGKTINRLGTVVFLFIFNIGISIFVFLLCGMMIFSQVLFIAFAMFLPVSFLISMLPSHENASKKALVKLFNTIMLRAGLTLVITVAFSISTMFYNISSEYPFFMIAFLQIVTFAGIYFKLDDIMSMFSLQATDSQQMGRRIFHKPYMYMNRRAKHIERRLNKIFRNKAKDKSYNKDNYNRTGSTNPTYESGGNAKDVMQSSESKGLPPNSLDTEESIEQGCKYFSSLIKTADEKGCDINTVVQSYNYGGGFIGYVSNYGKKYTFDLAQNFSKDKSGGRKVEYKNQISIPINGGWRYNYGNMFYVQLVSQYLIPNGFNDTTVKKIFNEALKYEGWKYVYGGSNPDTSFDCSGLVQWCYNKAGITLPRTAQQQYDATLHIPLKQAKAGDLVFFHSTYNTSGYVTHVGIYAGDNKMFHAGDPIGYADLTSEYWQKHLIGAGRIK